MAPFQALYGRRCRTPLNWSKPGEWWYFRTDLVKETEAKVQRIRQTTSILVLSNQRSRVPESITNEGCELIQGKRKVGTPLHWPVSHS
jgi:hypothetical protein